MGKSAPKPPPAPDPTTIINAQSQADSASALQQAKLNNVNYSGPQGTTTYSYDPGSGQFTQNVTLNPNEQAAEDAYQAAQRRAANVANTQMDLVGNALNQAPYLTPPSLTGGVQSGPLQTGYNPGGQIQTSVQNTPVQTGFGSSGPIQSGIANPGPIQGQVAPTYSPFGTLGMTPQGGAMHMGQPNYQGGASAPQGGGQQAGPYTPQGSGALSHLSISPQSPPGGAQTHMATNPAAASTASAGGSPGVQNIAHTLEKYDVAGHPMMLGKMMSQGGASAQDIASAIQSDPQAWATYQKNNPNAQIPPEVQALLNHPGAGQGAPPPGGGQPPAGGQPPPSQTPPTGSQPPGHGLPMDGLGPPQGQGPMDPYAAIASNPVASTQLATYAQARQMLDPQWQQAQEHQQAQLVAQGLNPNDAAYQNSQQLFGQQQNEAYNSALFGAINAGDQEQNTLFGQNLGSAQYALGAQNQNYNQLMGQAQLGNSAQLQNYNEQLGRADLYNSANGQLFGQNLAAGQFANSAQGQQNAQNAAAAGFYNTAQNQDFQQQLANAQLHNSAAQQGFQNQAYAQQLPINEFNSLMSASQVGMPPSGPAQNTTVAPANALGAYSLQQNALQNTYDAQMQNYQSGLGGLFSLGSAALKFLPK